MRNVKMEIENSKQIRSFEDLEVYKLARKLRNRIYELTKKLPNDEKYNLVDQMRRASLSLTSNIAEGYGRYHYQENIQYCRQARGSLYELLDHLTVALDENFITENMFNNLKENKMLKVIKMLNGYISYLKRRKENE